MGRTSPASPRQVIDVAELLNELRILAGRIMGVVEVLEADMADLDWGDDDRT